MAKIYIDKETLDGVQSDDLKSAAVEDKDTGKFVVDVVPASFRDANIQLKQTIEAKDQRLTTLAGIIGTDNPEEAAKEIASLRELRSKVENKKLVEDSSFEDALKTRTQEMRQIHEQNQRQSARALEEKEARISNLQAALDDSALSTQLQLAVMSDKSGIRPEAFPDILHRARRTFKIENGAPVARDEKNEQIYGEDANPLDINGWLKRLTDEAPFFLKGSAGGGASGGRGSASKFQSEDLAQMSQKDYEKYRAELRSKS